MNTAGLLRDLADRTTAERALPEADRPSGATDGTLDGVSRLLAGAADHLDSGDLPRARQELAGAAQLVGDGWSSSSTLGVEILRVTHRVVHAAT